MVIQDFANKTVFLDTAPLIYYLEGHSVYQPMLAALFDFNDTGGFARCRAHPPLPPVGRAGPRWPGR